MNSPSTPSAHSDTLVNKPCKVMKLYHERCKQFVKGNGSVIYPYVCPCGKWSFDGDTENGRFGMYKLEVQDED